MDANDQAYMPALDNTGTCPQRQSTSLTLLILGLYITHQISLCSKAASAELLLWLNNKLNNWISPPWVRFPSFHHESKRSVLALLQRLLCSLPEAVWPRFVSDAQIISQLHKDPEAQGGDPSEGPVIPPPPNTHTYTHTEALLLGGMTCYSHSYEWDLSG